MESLIRDLILEAVPDDGSNIGNRRLEEQVLSRLADEGETADADAILAVKELLIDEGRLQRGRGRGGSVSLAEPPDAAENPRDDSEDNQRDEDFNLERQEAPEARAGRTRKPVRKGVRRRAIRSGKPEVLSYRHNDKRRNNPEVGMVNETTDPYEEGNRWCYDPHIDPALQFDFGRAAVEKLIDDALASGDEASMRQALEELKRYSAPYLNWTGKAERTAFEVDSVSLHVHERIDPASILATVSKRLKAEKGGGQHQPDLFAAPFENLPLRDAVDFYRHEKGWSNRLVSGDSLLVMSSLLQKEGMAGRVQMIYIDPPYGIKYGSNFQPFVNKRDVKDRKDEDLTREPEMIKAFRDTWELGIHSYLTYLRDRLLLARELLSESGSVFVQISDENLHLVRNLLDEIFGAENFAALITYSTTGGFAAATLSRTGDYVLWYAKALPKVRFRRLYLAKNLDDAVRDDYDQLEYWSGERRAMSAAEKRDPTSIKDIGRPFTDDNPTSQGEGAATVDFVFRGMTFHPGSGNHWKAPLPHGMCRLARSVRFQITPRGKLRYVRYFADFDQKPVTNAWFDIAGSVQDRSDPKVYVVQTSNKIIERCLLMTTDPGDLVLDPTCGSGTTAFAAEKWGRRWITCDTSRVAATLAKQRLMTASYDYYALRYAHEGLKGGFIYKTVPHVTLKSIANNPKIDEIWERMHPVVETVLKDLNAALHPSPAGGRGAGGEGGDKDYVPHPPARLPDDLLRHARAMRRNASDAENLMWQLLRNRRLADAKFRRQHPVGKYIADFFCEACKLVIELDGGQHAEQQTYDERRTASLQEQGLEVLRFWNNQVMNETEAVLQVIWEHIAGHDTLTPTPLPPAGEGLKEWEVPFDFPEDWPEAARKPFDVFHAARQAMQKRMDDSIAAHADQETLYDQPEIDKTKLRITGPFSVEAVPFASVLSLEEAEQPREADAAIARSGESARQHQWRDELLKTGIRGKGGDILKFAELETLPGTRHLHVSGTLAETGERVVVSFGPEHAALEQRQVEHALREAGELFPLPKMIVFCAFAFDPEAAKDIDQMKGITALKAQMNTDLLTEDLKKGRASNQSFWLMGQPDVEVRKRKDGKYEVEVHGFDYFDTRSGELVSGGKRKIALWLLDTDYDDRSLFPKQVFFPMAGTKDGWNKLKKNIRAELNESLLDKFHGTVSLPFEAGENRKVAVKIVDDRGIESLKIVQLD